MIIQNNKTTSALYKGTKEIVKRYKGTTVVYEAWKQLTASGVPPITLQKCKGASNKLPSEYQEVEYIESTGTQYINTGFIPTRTMRVEDTVSDITSIDGGATLFGASGTSVNRIQVYHTRDPRFGARMFTQSVVANLIPNNLTDKRTVIFDCKNNIFSIDNNQSTTLADGDGGLFNYSLTIFGNNMTGAIATLSTHRQYTFKIYDNDMLVRNMIPCYRKSDNEIGMYDLVNGVFYENAGTGSFLKGEDVKRNIYLVDYKIHGNSIQEGILPSEYQQVEYIKTTGTQHIDSGVPLKSGLKIVVDWIYNDADSGNNYTGGHIGSPGNRWLVGSQRNSYYCFAIGGSNVATEFQFGNRDVVEACWKKLDSYIKVNDVESTKINWKQYNFTEEPNYTFYMGAVNRDGNATLKPKLTIYSWKFYQDDVLIRDYIPCYRKSDNVIGMYDLVEGKFYINNGTETFLKGNNIPVEIESVGDKTNNLYGGERDLTYSTVSNKTHESFYEAFEIGKTYTLFCYIDNTQATGTANIRMSVGRLVDGTNTWVYNISSNVLAGKEGYSKTTFTIPEDYNGQLNMQYQARNGTVTFKDIMLVEGSYDINSLPTYEPYGYKIPVKVTNSSLISDRMNNILTSGGTGNTVKYADDWAICEMLNNDQATNVEPGSVNYSSGWVRIGHNYSDVSKWYKVSYDIEYLEIIKGEFNFPVTHRVSQGGGTVLNTQIEGLGKKYHIEKVWQSNGEPAIFTLNSCRVKISNFRLYESDNEITTNTTNLYLNEPLRKLGEYADYIDYVNQKVVRNVSNKVFDGTEEWAAHTSTNEGTVFRNENLLTPLIGAPTAATFMSHFSLTDIYSTATWIAGLYRFAYNSTDLTINSSRLYISSAQTTVDEFKTWLSENKPTLMYPLAEPDDTEIVSLPGIPLNKGTNIIEVDTNIIPSNMEVVYIGKKVK